MGKKWDGQETPQASYRFHRMWATEALRVLKPGGHLLAFGGTRTYHRLASAVEDAGFEIRDSVIWCYGCLSEDSEALTKRGWVKGPELRHDDEVLQWDAPSDTFSWVVPTNITLAPYSGSMMRLLNRNTDQLLTPNHRVYARVRKHSRNEYDATYTVYDAETLANRSQAWHVTLPCASTLDEGREIDPEYAYIVGWWLTDAWPHADGKACMFSQSKPETLEKLRAALAPHGPSEYVRPGRKPTHAEEHTFYLTGPLANRLRTEFPDRRLSWDVLSWSAEARRSLYQGLMDGDGSQPEIQHAHTFWTKDAERRDVFLALATTLGYRSCIGATKDCVYVNTNTATTEVQGKHRTDSLAYEGMVWCVTVPSGAFLARRAGKPFITGNSGFPKSLDISKAIDKRGGVIPWQKEFAKHLKATRPKTLSVQFINDHVSNGTKSNFWGHFIDTTSQPLLPTVEQYRKLREILPIDPSWDAHFLVSADREVVGYKTAGIANPDEGKRHTIGASQSVTVEITAPSTDAARQWEGWGTALKPAHEPIVVARKPLVGTVAANVLKHGTGGLNIDGCRVSWSSVGDLERAKINGTSYDKARARNALNKSASIGTESRGPSDTYDPAEGRWPANLMLSHSECCVRVDSDEDTDLYACVPGCPIRAMDAQSGPSGGCAPASGPTLGKMGKHGIYGKAKGENMESVAFHGKVDGASRFFMRFDPYDAPFIYAAKSSTKDRSAGLEERNSHPTVKSQPLMKYLCRLVTPPGGVVLDPFMGSGSTGVAAISEGFRFIGIEREAEYFDIASKRLAHAARA